jgi:hypothetical protein
MDELPDGRPHQPERAAPPAGRPRPDEGRARLPATDRRHGLTAPGSGPAPRDAAVLQAHGGYPDQLGVLAVQAQVIVTHSRRRPGGRHG